MLAGLDDCQPDLRTLLERPPPRVKSESELPHVLGQNFNEKTQDSVYYAISLVDNREQVCTIKILRKIQPDQDLATAFGLTTCKKERKPPVFTQGPHRRSCECVPHTDFVASLQPAEAHNARAFWTKPCKFIPRK